MPLFKGFFVSLQSIRGQYASIISTIVDLQDLRPCRRWLVCFNNFYYCRQACVHLLGLAGQYASIISTIVDMFKVRCSLACGQYASIISTIVDRAISYFGYTGLVCFNNFYYCRSSTDKSLSSRLVCFNNFYYCRYFMPCVGDKGLVCFNNFYYCRLAVKNRLFFGQYASIISTIVDLLQSRPYHLGLVCFNNFYYCRCEIKSE